MKFNKIVAATAAVTMIFTAITAGAEFSGTYPSCVDYTIKSSSTTAGPNTSWTVTEHDEYTFAVSGKEFTVLDTDTEGNYLVLANNMYGRGRFLKGTQGMLDNENLTSSEVNYNPENENSIAYYMDNDFITGNGKTIPDSVKNNILGIKEGTEKPTWKVENEFISYSADANNIIKNNAEQAARLETWLANNGSASREIQAAIVLPSYTELETYKTRAAFPYEASSWNGPITRTFHQTVNANTDKTAIKFGGRFFMPRYIPSTKNFSLWRDGEIDNWVITGDNYAVMPMFMLDKDFFANVKVDFNKLGTEIKNEIIKADIGSLKNIYTDEELLSLGIDVSVLPEVSNIDVAGLRTAGAATELFYDFKGKEGTTEGNSKYEIYVSDTKDGDYVLNETLTEWKALSEDYANKYVKVAVVPVDELGRKGVRVMSDAYYIEETPSEAYVSDVAVAKEGTALKANVTVEGSESDVVKVVIAEFNSDNCMMRMVVSETDTAEAVLENALGTGIAYAKVMVTVNNKPVYFTTVK